MWDQYIEDWQNGNCNQDENPKDVEKNKEEYQQLREQLELKDAIIEQLKEKNRKLTKKLMHYSHRQKK